MMKEAMEKKKVYAAFFVEGKTEAVFYRLLTDYLASRSQREDLPILKFIDLKGENNFRQKLNAKSLSLYIQKHPANRYSFFFCYDHDLFPNEPPIDWGKMKTALPSENVEAHFISPIEQIEDWFFLDSQSLLKYLRLPADFDIAPYKKLHSRGLRKLFWKRHKVYRKGERAEALIKALSFPILIEKIGEPLEPILALFSEGA